MQRRYQVEKKLFLNLGVKPYGISEIIMAMISPVYQDWMNRLPKGLEILDKALQSTMPMIPSYKLWTFI